MFLDILWVAVVLFCVSCALAEPDCRPKAAAPNSNAAPSANETSFFMITYPFSCGVKARLGFGNEHANNNHSLSVAKRRELDRGL